MIVLLIMILQVFAHLRKSLFQTYYEGFLHTMI